MPRSRIAILRTILEVGAIPTFTPVDLASGQRVISASIDAGAPVLEITNRSAGTLELFRELAAWASEEVPDVVLGAGTILDAPTAAMYLAVGAQFIVSPTFDADVARLCNRRRIAYLPGCGTATEIAVAESFGVEIVKLFPAAAVDGAAFIRGIHGPNPMTRIMPTNVEATDDATRAWFEAGAACLGIGPHLITEELQRAEDPAALRRRLRAYMTTVEAFRPPSY